jgi:hypothetical protein
MNLGICGALLVRNEFCQSGDGSAMKRTGRFTEGSDEEAPRLHSGLEFIGADRNARVSRWKNTIE